MRRRRTRPSRTSSPVFRDAFRPAPLWLEDRTLLSTIAWASDISGDWDNPSMWSGDVVPGAGDDAVIPFGDITVTHTSAVNDTVDSINCEAVLDLTSGSLTIDTTSPRQPSSTVSGAFNLGSGASLQLWPVTSARQTAGRSVGRSAAASDTTFNLNGQDLTASSVVSSDGFVSIT